MRHMRPPRDVASGLRVSQPPTFSPLSPSLSLTHKHAQHARNLSREPKCARNTEPPNYTGVGDDVGDTGKKHAHKNGLVEQHDFCPPVALHPTVLDLVDPVFDAWRFDTLVHPAHVRDPAGVNADVELAPHAVHVENVCSFVTPDSIIVNNNGPLKNCAHVGAT